VNGGRNYNGPKVSFASLSKIWLFAGKSEYPTLREPCVKMRWVQIISRKDQQEIELKRFVKGHGFSRAVTAAKSMGL
jgi:hypothetical protein